MDTISPSKEVNKTMIDIYDHLNDDIKKDLNKGKYFNENELLKDTHFHLLEDLKVEHQDNIRLTKELEFIKEKGLNKQIVQKDFEQQESLKLVEIENKFNLMMDHLPLEFSKKLIDIQERIERSTKIPNFSFYFKDISSELIEELNQHHFNFENGRLDAPAAAIGYYSSIICGNPIELEKFWNIVVVNETVLEEKIIEMKPYVESQCDKKFEKYEFLLDIEQLKIKNKWIRQEIQVIKDQNLSLREAIKEFKNSKLDVKAMSEKKYDVVELKNDKIIYSTSNFIDALKNEVEKLVSKDILWGNKLPDTKFSSIVYGREIFINNIKQRLRKNSEYILSEGYLRCFKEELTQHFGQKAKNAINIIQEYWKFHYEYLKIGPINHRYSTPKLMKDLQRVIQNIAPIEVIKEGSGSLTDAQLCEYLGQDKHYKRKILHIQLKRHQDFIISFINLKVFRESLEKVFKEKSKKAISLIDSYIEINKPPVTTNINDVRYHHPNLKQDFFEIINTKEKAYWLGFFNADGYRHENNRIGVELSKKDGDQLDRWISTHGLNSDYKNEKMKKLNYKGKVRKYPQTYIEFSSDKMTNDLTNLGIYGSKSLKTTFPILENREFELAFLLGYYDGDGTQNRTVITSGSKLFLEQIKQKFKIPNLIRKDMRTINSWSLALGAKLMNEMQTNYHDSMLRKKKYFERENLILEFFKN